MESFLYKHLNLALWGSGDTIRLSLIPEIGILLALLGFEIPTQYIKVIEWEFYHLTHLPVKFCLFKFLWKTLVWMWLINNTLEITRYLSLKLVIEPLHHSIFWNLHCSECNIFWLISIKFKPRNMKCNSMMDYFWEK